MRLAQTFTPARATLTAVEIDLITGNRGLGGDEITVSVVVGRGAVSTRSQPVAEGFDGPLRFDFPAPVSVIPGVAVSLQVEDFGKEVFGWRYGSNTYPGGVAFLNGAPWDGGVYDFFFRTYGY